MTDLIFLHGFLSSPHSRKIGHFLQHLPDSHIAPLINNYRVVDLYPTQSDFESMTITKLVDRIGKDLSLNNTPSILIGSSHGVLMALAVQQAYSEMVKGLVLLSPAIKLL